MAPSHTTADGIFTIQIFYKEMLYLFYLKYSGVYHLSFDIQNTSWNSFMMFRQQKNDKNWHLYNI